MLLDRSTDIVNLFYPNTCVGCSSVLHRGEDLLCISCLLDLPYTRMHDLPYNTAEMRIWGRFEFTAATSLLFFMKDGKVQRMIHELKYLGAEEVGIYLGKQLAEALQSSIRFEGIDCIVPVPIHPRKRKARGYNQVELIGQGMEERGYTLMPHALRRTHDSESQTSKSMTERYHNVHGLFDLGSANMLRGKKVLLIDDVLTTGATLEACALELLKINGLELYVATIACAEF